MKKFEELKALAEKALNEHPIDSFQTHRDNFRHECDPATILDLLADRENLREALKFYGNEMNYSVDDYRGISGEMINRCLLYSDCEERNDVYSYAGKRARAALKKSDEVDE